MEILLDTFHILAAATESEWHAEWTTSLVRFYSENLRASMFAGFLTLGGFLLSAKTFIVVKMKEGVYDTEEYAQLVKTQRSLRPKSRFYGPLRNLSGLLFYSILLSLITAVCQLTLGLIPHVVPVVACLGLAMVTIVLMIISLCLLRANLRSWFDQMEKAKTGT